MRTRTPYADAIRAALGASQTKPGLSQHELLVLTAISYFQPLTRAELSALFGKEVNRDTIPALRGDGFIVSGPRSPQPDAPYTYVTTPAFLAHFGFESLRDLPDMERLEDAGLLSEDKWLSGNLSHDFGREDVLKNSATNLDVDVAFDD